MKTVEINGEIFTLVSSGHTFTLNRPFKFDVFSTETSEPEDDEHDFPVPPLPPCPAIISMHESNGELPTSGDASGKVAKALPLFFNSSPLDTIEEEVAEMEADASMEAASRQETAVFVPVLLSAPQPAAPKPDEAALPAVATLDSLNSTVADEIGSAISNCGGDSPLRKLKKKKQPKKKKTTKPQSISDRMPKDTLPEGTEKVCAPCSLPTSVCRYMYPPPPSLRLGCEPACPCTGCVPVVCQHCQ